MSDFQSKVTGEGVTVLECSYVGYKSGWHSLRMAFRASKKAEPGVRSLKLGWREMRGVSQPGPNLPPVEPAEGGTKLSWIELWEDLSMEWLMVKVMLSTSHEDSEPSELRSNLMPDLVVSKVISTPANPTTIDRIMINVEIRNQGNAAAFIPKGATTFLATKPTGGGVGRESKGETILPNASFSGSLHLFNAGELKPGTYQIKVMADPENRVVESNKANNQLLYSLTVSSGGATQR
jgi:hypothetical protein